MVSSNMRRVLILSQSLSIASVKALVEEAKKEDLKCITVDDISAMQDAVATHGPTPLPDVYEIRCQEPWVMPDIQQTTPGNTQEGPRRKGKRGKPQRW